MIVCAIHYLVAGGYLVIKNFISNQREKAADALFKLKVSSQCLTLSQPGLLIKLALKRRRSQCRLLRIISNTKELMLLISLNCMREIIFAFEMIMRMLLNI
jgi:hypothetical protein